jgi:hypothetical protein
MVNVNFIEAHVYKYKWGSVYFLTFLIFYTKEYFLNSMLYRYTTSILKIFLKLLELLPREFKNTKLNYEVVYL